MRAKIDITEISTRVHDGRPLDVILLPLRWRRTMSISMLPSPMTVGQLRSIHSLAAAILLILIKFIGEAANKDGSSKTALRFLLCVMLTPRIQE